MFNRSSRSSILFLLLIVLFALDVQANDSENDQYSQRLGFGIVRSNLVWQPTKADPRTGVQIIDQIAKIKGVEAIRTDIRGLSTMDRAVAIIKEANNKGLNVLTVVAHAPEDFPLINGSREYAIANNTENFTHTCGYSGGAYKLSSINMDLYSKRLETYLKTFIQNGLKISAFEIGNEFSWVCFNGDMPLGQQLVSPYSELTVQTYANMLKVSYQLIKSYYPNSKVITFGFTFGLKSSISPKDFLGKLTEMGAMKYADGIGIHMYPPNMNKDQLHSWMSDRFALITNEIPSEKELWITEWGAGVWLGSEKRFKLYKNFLEYVTSEKKHLNLVYTFLYDFDSKHQGIYDAVNQEMLDEAKIFQLYGNTLNY